MAPGTLFRCVHSLSLWSSPDNVATLGNPMHVVARAHRNDLCLVLGLINADNPSDRAYLLLTSMGCGWVSHSPIDMHMAVGSAIVTSDAERAAAT